MKKIGYIQATSKTEIEEQSEILIKFGCIKIYVEPKEHISFESKVILNKLIASLTERDIIAVTRLSILSWSIESLLEILFELGEKKIILQAVEQQLNTSAANYTLEELLFYIAEFLEEIRYEKQIVGLHNAKERGIKLGRPPKLMIADVLKAIELKHNNTSRQVANRFGVGRSTLLRHIARMKKAS